MQKWLFEPLDTLFFRDGFSIDKGETGYLESIFPPYPETMFGIVRSAILQSNCIDIKKFGDCRCTECDNFKKCILPNTIGSPLNRDKNVSLKLFGHYLVKNNVPYYPAPLDLAKERQRKELFSLVPSDSIPCDLGNIQLPTKPINSDYRAFEIIEGWINKDDLSAYMEKGIIPTKILEDKNFYEKEPKVGIERDYKTHKIEKGNLYSIVPLRFKDNVKIGVLVDGVDKTILEKLNNSFMKVGGEGKLCKLEIEEDTDIIKPLEIKKGEPIKLLLLQPSDFNNNWGPFESNNKNEITIQNNKFKFISGCVGRAVKIGGWDIVKKAVKPMKSYIPAGSVYYLEALDNCNIFHEGKIGQNCNIGYGQYILGRCKKCLKKAY